MTLLRETFDINNIHPILVVVLGGGGGSPGVLFSLFYPNSPSSFSSFSLPHFSSPPPYSLSISHFVSLLPPLFLPYPSPLFRSLSPFLTPSRPPPPCTPVLCSPLLRWVGDILRINTIAIRDKMKAPLNQGQHKRSTQTVELTEPNNISGRSVPTGCLYAYWK